MVRLKKVSLNEVFVEILLIRMVPQGPLGSASLHSQGINTLCLSQNVSRSVCRVVRA